MFRDVVMILGPVLDPELGALVVVPELLEVACRLTAAAAALVLSAELVAVTVTVCAEVIDAGAVYRPLVEIVPADGLIAQVTAVFVDPETEAVNCCVMPAAKVLVEGLIEIVTAGCRLTVAVAFLVLSAELVAVTVTVCAEVIDAGAVYRPLVEIVPADGLIAQVTAVFVEPETEAVNCCVLPAARVLVEGLIEIVTAGCRLTVAVAFLVLSAELVAVTVTVCAEVIDAGAVYRPLVEIVPADGLIAQVTAVFVEPETEAVNCCVLPAARVLVEGLIEIVTAGCRLMVAVAVLVLSAELVAVTVTVCAEVIDAGAVYRPLVEIVPADGLIAQVTAVFVEPETEAVNCCVLPAWRLTLDGAKLIVTVGCEPAVMVT
jgi:hypothetical protein